MKTIQINTVENFEDVAADILDEFTESFSISNGCIDRVNSAGFQLFSQKGEQLYERYQARLRAVGEKLFPGEGAEMRIEAWRVNDDADAEY